MKELDAFEKLQREMRFEPSPDFEARVRERVRRMPVKPGFVFAWLFTRKPGLGVLAAAVGLVALIGAGMWRAPAATPEPVPSLKPGFIFPEPSKVAVKPGFNFRSKGPGKMKPGFKIIVAPDQALALNGFLEGLRERSSMRATSVGAPIETEPQPDPDEAADGKPQKSAPPTLGPPISTIVVVPIKVELLTPAGSGGGSWKFLPNR